MKVLTAGSGADHRPKFELDNGQRLPANEVPERVGVILSAVTKLPNVEVVFPPAIRPSLLHAIHCPEYVKHLQEASDALRADGNSAEEPSYPSVFPSESWHKGHGSKGRRGQFASDTYTPLFASTFEVAIGSAAAAVGAANVLVEEGEGVVYALCRPPGHHAESARSGGYCYFNNAGLAAHQLARLGRVAVIDVDVHHGNGTQSIFYARDDVVTASLHGDPTNYFPHFSGFEDETGTGRGLGANRNIPLPRDTDERAYQPAFETTLDWVAGHRPTFLVVAFGADTHEADPIGCFKLPTPYYRRLGEMVRHLDLPIVVVQEGGYNLEYLGEVAANFLDGLSGDRRVT